MGNAFLSENELPLALTVNDVASVLGIGRRQAYELCHSKGFPCIKVGRRMVIPKIAFLKWMEDPKTYKGV